MQIKKILKDEEIKEIEKIIEKNYNTLPNLKDYLVFISSEDKIWIARKETLKFLEKDLKINSIGLYIGKLKRNNKIHLSLEGIHFFAKNANKNVVSVDKDGMIKFMRGSDINNFERINCEVNNFVLVKYKEDFIGVGILRDDKLENLLPKSRRIYEAPVV